MNELEEEPRDSTQSFLFDGVSDETDQPSINLTPCPNFLTAKPTTLQRLSLDGAAVRRDAAE